MNQERNRSVRDVSQQSDIVAGRNAEIEITELLIEFFLIIVGTQQCRRMCGDNHDVFATSAHSD